MTMHEITESTLCRNNKPPTVHRVSYPGCIGRPSSWLTSPLGLNLLMAIIKGARDSKYFKIQDSLKSKKLCNIKTGIFYTSQSQGPFEMLRNKMAVEQIDIGQDNLPNVFLQWVNKHADFSEFHINEKVPPAISFAMANVFTFESAWKQSSEAKGRNMKVHNSFTYTQDINYEARILELPLTDEEFKLILLVPNEVDPLHTLYRRLSSDGLSAAFSSLRPLFTVDAVFQAPSVTVSSQAQLAVAQENESKSSDESVVQFGNVSINEDGVNAKVLTCLFPSKSPPMDPESPKPQEKLPHFFAIAYEDTPIFTGQYDSSL